MSNCKSRKTPFGIFVLGFVFVLGTMSIANADVTVEISGNGIERRDTFATVLLPSACDDWNAVVVSDGDGNTISAQVSAMEPSTSASNLPKRLFIAVNHLDANESRRVSVRRAEPPTRDANDWRHSNRLRIEDRNGGYYFQFGDKTVLRYNHAIVESPEGLDQVYRRSGHIHPLFSPAGRLITDDFCPTDHTHQHGIMFAWTNTTFEGRKLNFWEQIHEQAIVRHAKTRSLTVGPVFAELIADIDHIDITSGDEIQVLSEEWRLRVYQHSSKFVFDLQSTQRCATSSPLLINEYHYGGIAIRGNRNWETANSGFLTSNGKRRDDGNHDRPNWCDMSGAVDGGRAGVALFCHPQNFRSAQPVRIHPSMPYFCYAPLVLGDFEISEEKPFVSNYRFVAHDGDIDPMQANQMWLDYAHPITTRIVEAN